MDEAQAGHANAHACLKMFLFGKKKYFPQRQQHAEDNF
jgi:hypothetical protein